MVELLQLAAAGKIKPRVQVVDFSDIGSVVDKLKEGGITGRVVARVTH